MENSTDMGLTQSIRVQGFFTFMDAQLLFFSIMQFPLLSLVYVSVFAKSFTIIFPSFYSMQIPSL